VNFLDFTKDFWERKTDGPPGPASGYVVELRDARGANALLFRDAQPVFVPKEIFPELEGLMRALSTPDLHIVK
jgi:hypothetical protein